jgi:uncharacterized protein YvpB
MSKGSSIWRSLISLVLLLGLAGVILVACLVFFEVQMPASPKALSALTVVFPSSQPHSAGTATRQPTWANTRTPFQPLPSSTRTNTEPPPTATLTPTATVPSPTPSLTPTVTKTRKPRPTHTPGPTHTPAPPAEAAVDGVVGHSQLYTLDCEARSAVDLASFFGVNIDERDFLRKLPKSDNPEDGFVGDVRGPTGQLPPASYGVYSKPIAALLRDYGLLAHAKKDFTWGSVQAEIAAGRPVMVWIIGNTWPGYAVDYTTPDGQTTYVANYEHTAIVTAYDETTVTIADGSMVYQRTLTEFLQSWGVLHDMAVTVSK